MPAHQRNPQIGDCGMELGEQPADAGVGRTDRQQDGGQEPAGTDPHHGHVVGVHAHGRPTNALARQRDRIGGDHEAPGLDIDGRGVLPEGRAQPHLVGQRRSTGEHLAQQRWRQLAPLQHASPRRTAVNHERSVGPFGPAGQRPTSYSPALLQEGIAHRQELPAAGSVPMTFSSSAELRRRGASKLSPERQWNVDMTPKPQISDDSRPRLGNDIPAALLLDAFREDHARMGQGLYELSQLLQADDVRAACALAQRIDEESGAHIAFEETNFYPRLSELLSRTEIDRMYEEHGVGADTVRTLLDHKPEEPLDSEEKERLVIGATQMSEHISECGELFGALGAIPVAEQTELLEQLVEWRRRRPRWTAFAAGRE